MFLGLSTVTLVTLTLAAGMYLLVRIWRRYWLWSYKYQCISRLPGVKFDPLMGGLSEMPGPGEDGYKFVQDTIPNYPRLAYMFLGPLNYVVSVSHPDTIKEILKTSEPKPLDIGGYYCALPWLGLGLLTSGGRKWARNRRLLSPVFHFDILKPYTLVNNTSAHTLVRKMDSQRGDYFDVFPLVSLCTLEIVLKCAFSFTDDVQGDGDSHPYVKAVQSLSSIMVHRSLRPWLYPDLTFALSPSGREFNRCCHLVHGIASDVIQRRKHTLESEGMEPSRSKRMLDFLDILLTARDEGGKGLTDREIRDEVDTFLFEGHDTTASGISWMLYSMAQNPEWQRQCQDEIDDIFRHRSTEDILWDDLPRFRVLTACLKESLRYHTPVPDIQRKTTRDMYIDGYFIPQGTTVDIQLYAMMHNQLVWENPMEFKPERFLDEETVAKRDSYAFLPFSAGPRNCIGQHFAMHEMKIVLAHVLRNLWLTVDPTRPAKHLFSVVTKTEDGMFIRAERREPQT